MNEIRLSSRYEGTIVTTGTVQCVQDPYCIIEDETGRSIFRINNKLPTPSPGDLIAVTCRKATPTDHDKRLMAVNLSVLGKGQVSPAVPFRLEDLDSRRHDLLTIITEGTVVDVVPDEVDVRFDVLLLKDGATRLPLFVANAPDNRTLSGARIRVTARYDRLVSGIRRFSGPFLSAEKSDITILEPPKDPFAAPALDPGDYLTPQEVMLMDRRTLTGTVLATWGGNNLMLRTGNVISNIKLVHGLALPPINSAIMASGYPAADLYKINLVKAEWKPLSAPTTEEDTPRPISLRQITHRTGKGHEIDYTFHGQAVRLSGTVHSLPVDEEAERKLVLDANGKRISVDFSSCADAIKGVLPGCEIEITGRCLLDVAAWQPYDVFPQITGVTILLRTPDDLRILKTPPWWTPARLTGLVIALALLLVCVFIWNRLLNRLVERRGRQLYRADIERARETLRVDERTRLAVELHDSLSQNLTGVALQLKTGRIELAAQALKSCREELRNCLWDLRNNTIDCDNMGLAISQTIAPQAEGIRCSVRFNVPRRTLSDNTAYAILHIVRELVANAVRHGHATIIHVAGSIEPNRLLFSVRDNGCGFDPENRPGVDEGHFGLQGVQERVDTLDGEMTVSSKAGGGTKIVIILPVIRTLDERQSNS